MALAISPLRLIPRHPRPHRHPRRRHPSYFNGEGFVFVRSFFLIICRCCDFAI